MAQRGGRLPPPLPADREGGTGRRSQPEERSRSVTTIAARKILTTSLGIETSCPLRAPRESNQGPIKAHHGHLKVLSKASRTPVSQPFPLVGRVGLEPTTGGL